MADEQLFEAQQDIFVEHEECLAATVRQLFRAQRAKDAKAVQLESSFLEEYLTNRTLVRHLSKCDAAWDSALRPLDFSSHRWFDGLSAEPQSPAPGRLRLRGEVYWLIGQAHGYYDPLDFEIELCPKTGTFRSYALRFGDYRPLAAKVSGSAMSGSPLGAWAYEFVRRRAGQVARTSG